MKSVFKPILLCAITLLFAQQAAWACSKTLRMGTNEVNWAPYIIKQGNKFVGIEIDTINTVFEDSSFCVSWHYFPSLLRVQEELKHGRIDITFAASFTEQRARYAHFSLPYRQETMLLYKHTEAASVDSLAAVFKKGYSAGVNRGSFFGEQFEQLRAQYPEQVVLTGDANKRFGMLNKKRVDYVIDDSIVAQYFAKKYVTVEQAKNVPPVNVNGVHFMMSKKSVSVSDVAAVNALIKKNQAAIAAIYGAI